MYIHKVQYYETDMMGITHHSNYIRWMEEARIAYLDEIGCSYGKMEKEGIISPITSVECKYKRTTTFEDVVTIEPKIVEFKGVKIKLCYTMTNETGEVVCEAKSEHCFLNKNGEIISLKRERPDIYQLIADRVEA